MENLNKYKQIKIDLDTFIKTLQLDEYFKNYSIQGIGLNADGEVSIFAQEK